MTALLALPLLPLAACRDADPEMFFYDGTADAPGTAARIAKAKRVCEGCGARDECLQFALATGQHGIWGGTDDDERRNAAQRERASRHRENRRVVA